MPASIRQPEHGVGVQRHVAAVELADPKVHDAWSDGRAVVGWHAQNITQRRKRRVIEVLPRHVNDGGGLEQKLN